MLHRINLNSFQGDTQDNLYFEGSVQAAVSDSFEVEVSHGGRFEFDGSITFSKIVPITLTKGETGASGATGAQGPAGADGATGLRGLQGTPGVDGTDGKDGADGNDGVDGQQGPQGEQGIQGPAGTDGATGAQGPQGEQGIQGPAGLKGDQGAQGAQGPAGADGVDGKDGVDGVNGSNGIQGPQGEQGIQGPKGDIGPTGPTGPAGPAGADGQDADPITHSGSGNQSDSFTGNDGVIDTFEIKTKSKYNKRTADVITNFSTKDGDQLGLDCDELGLNKIRFKIVNNKKVQKKHCSRGTNLIYNKNNNKLFVDLNGKEKGFGDGGLLAKFDDNTVLNKNSITNIIVCNNLGGTADPVDSSF